MSKVGCTLPSGGVIQRQALPCFLSFQSLYGSGTKKPAAIEIARAAQWDGAYGHHAAGEEIVSGVFGEFHTDHGKEGRGQGHGEGAFPGEAFAEAEKGLCYSPAVRDSRMRPGGL